MRSEAEMRAFCVAGLALFAAALLLGDHATAADISVHGEVTSLEHTPIPMIKVSAYHDARLIQHVFTDDQGRYQISLPSGEPVTLRFDTHPTLTNARDWHPSVVVSVAASADISLDRSLLKVGATGGEAADIDALAAYEFAAMWTDRGVDTGSEQYGAIAAARLAEMKFTTDVLLEIQKALITHFQGGH